VARGFQPMTQQQKEALLARSREFGESSKGEPYKTTTGFDNQPPATPPPYEA